VQNRFHTRKKKNTHSVKSYKKGGIVVQQEMVKSGIKRERKIISVSTKRQLTIPQKYYDLLGFDNEAECVLQADSLLIKPLQSTNTSEFSEQILADLISQGLEGAELLNAFKEYSKSIRPAIQKLIKETDEFAKSGKGRMSLDELFGKGE